MPFPKIFANTTSPVLTQSLDDNFNYGLYNFGGYRTTTGSGNAYVLTPDPAITAYSDGLSFIAFASFSNTGFFPTINVNGLGAKSIRSSAGGGSDILPNMIQIGDLYQFTYYGGAFVATRLAGQQRSTLCINPGADNYELSGNGASPSGIYYLHTAAYPHIYLQISFVDSEGQQGYATEVAYGAGTITTIRAVVEAGTGSPVVRILKRVLTVSTGATSDSYLTMDGIYALL